MSTGGGVASREIVAQNQSWDNIYLKADLETPTNVSADKDHQRPLFLNTGGKNWQLFSMKDKLGMRK